MNAEGHEAAVCSVDDAEARAELDRLLSDHRFHATERSRQILRYIAERHFDGQAEGVKAYSIAIDVLGRPCSFDPSLDPIVRIEMSRLRSSLAQYYEAFGDERDIAIHLPKGRYIAAFSHAAAATTVIGDETEEIADLEERGVEAVPHPARIAASPPLHRRWFAVATGAIVLVAAVSTAAIWLGQRPEFTERPSVMLSMSAATAAYQGEADMTADYLLSALLQFRTLTIASQRDVATGSLSAVLRPRHTNSYDIDLKYYADSDDRSVWWQVVDSRSRDVLKSGVERVQTDGKSAVAVRSELVGMLAKRFATTRGVINNLETHDEASAGSLGNTCVLKAEYGLDEGGPDGIAAAGGCLEETVAAQIGNSDAAAALSRVLLASQPGAPAPATLDRAVDLASHAVSIAPTSDRANIALMIAQFYSGRTEAAIAAGNRALAINPNNPDVSAKLASVLFAAGYWDAGVTLAEDASQSVDAVPRDASMVLALDAYRRGDYSNASLLAEQINCSDFLVRALRAAALGQLGSSAAAERLAKLRTIAPDFQSSFRIDMNARRYDRALVAGLEAGLVKAGAQFETAGSVQ